MKRQNLTLSADPQLIEAGREYARKHGTTLNAMFRDFLQNLGGSSQKGAAFEGFIELADKLNANSKGWKFDREEAYRR